MEKVSNKEVLENIAKNIMKAESQEQITAFVSMVVYGILLVN